jgi:hypothetical protein
VGRSLLAAILIGWGIVHCGSPYATDAPDPGRDAGTRDAGGGPSPDGGEPAPVDAGGDAAPDASPGPSTTCPAPAPTIYPTYTHPPVRGKPCSPADRDAYRDHQSQSYAEQKAAMVSRNALCAACVFTKDGDQTWAPSP